ncbi:MAG: cupin-like domain-containing protein [Myxococcales bacterium]|nr:cupin-like domain-containing protein [Myxococcales bacterium]
MKHPLMREIERQLIAHLRDGVARGAATLDRGFVYRFVFDDLDTQLDFAVEPDSVRVVSDAAPQAQARMSAMTLFRMLWILRNAPDVAQQLRAAGVVLEGERRLHEAIFVLAKGPLAHFVEALESADDRGAAAPRAWTLERLEHTDLELTRRAAERALREPAPLLISDFPAPWRGISYDELIARYGAARTWVTGEWVDVASFFAPDAAPEAPARSAISPHAALYAMGVVTPDALLADFRPPLFAERCAAPKLFAGCATGDEPWSLVVRPHRHAHDAIAWQVLGTKKWIISPPRSGPFLQPAAVGFDSQFCAVPDPESIDDETFRADCCTFTMQPGDVLVLPGGWYHTTYVRAEPTLSFSAFARDELLRLYA